MNQKPDLQHRQPLGTGPGPGEMVSITPDVLWFRIVSPGAPLGGVNVWALRDGSGWALVDTGFADPGSQEQWTAIIAQLGGPVSRIICTHFHPDHIGQVGNLLRRFDVPLMMTEPEWLRAMTMAAPRDPAMTAKYAEHLHRCGLPGDQIEQIAKASSGPLTSGLPERCSILRAGDKLELGSGSWSVAIGQGHSPAPAILHNERDKLLIAGDQILMRITPHIGIEVEDLEADPLGAYLSYLNGAEAISPDTLALPGHGPAFAFAATRAQEIAEHHRERLDVLADALGEPKTVAETIGTLFGRELKGVGLLLGLSEAHAHLQHLVRQGRAHRYTDDSGRYIFQCG